MTWNQGNGYGERFPLVGAVFSLTDRQAVPIRIPSSSIHHHRLIDPETEMVRRDAMVTVDAKDSVAF